MRALLLGCLAATASALAAPARGTDALVSVGACVAESRLAVDRAPVVLRVSPWAGGGAQVTLGVRWDDPLGNTVIDTLEAYPVGDVVAYAATASAEPSPPRALPSSRHADARNKNISADENPNSLSSSPRAEVAAAFATPPGGVGATVIAIDPGDSLITAEAAVETALAVVRSVPRDEEVAVFALKSDPREKNKPILVADFRAPRLGGLRHVERRTRAFLNAFEKQLTNEAASETNDDRRETRRDDIRSYTNTETLRDDSSFLFDSLLGELKRWRADPEGPTARDVVVVAPTTPKTLMRLTETSANVTKTKSFSVAPRSSSSSESRVLTPSIPEGGGWALTLMLADRVEPPKIVAFQTESKARVSVIATGWGARAAAARAALVRARRRSIARVGVCGGETTSTFGNSDVVSFRVRVGSDLFFRCAVAAPNNVASSFGVSERRDDDDDVFGVGETCSAPAAALDAYPYPDAIAIRMSASQRARFDAKRSFFRGSHRASLFAKTETEARVQFLSDTTFRNARIKSASVLDVTRTHPYEALSEHASDDDDITNDDVNVTPTSPPLDATVRFRGVSSLRDCARRKSMKVNLKGKGRFRLAPGSANDEFLLISMCYDDRYVKSKLVFSLAKRIGAFPHAARYVRVLIENPLRPESSSDGSTDPVFENEGLYLLVDDPVSSLERRFTRLETVVRRRNDAKRATEPGKGTPEVKRPKALDLESAYLRRYDRLALVAATCETSETSRVSTAPRDELMVAEKKTSTTGPLCYEALDERLDLEQYFRWTALMTLVGSGDHVDETWFYASDARYSIHAWDPDDAFQPCHHSGLNALQDPHGLLICAEGDLDKVFTRDQRTYLAYVDAFEWTLRNALSAEVLQKTAETEVLLELQKALVDDATASGLSELVAANPDAKTKQGALNDIEGSLAFYTWTLRERRRLLLRKIARYRDFLYEKNVAELANGSVPFEPVQTPARAALRREHARFPFEVNRGVFRSAFERPNTGRRTTTASKSQIVFSASVREYRYDAAPGSGFQELVARDVALTNEAKEEEEPYSLSSLESLLPTVYFPVRAEVTYGNETYRAPPSETRVACFETAVFVNNGTVSDDGDIKAAERFLAPSLTTRAFDGSEVLVVDDDLFDDAFRGASFNATSSSCALRGSRVVDARTGKQKGASFDSAAFFAAGDGFIAFRFARRLDSTTGDDVTTNRVRRERDWVPITLGPGQRFETRTAISVFHRDWLPFPKGVSRAETEK